jgi:cystathionine beta-lyase/cystathionine gamma-synthase
MSEKPVEFSTACIHAGEIPDQFGAPHTPLYDTTTFGFARTADLLDVVEGRKDGYMYTRYGMNPSIRSLEGKLAALDGAEEALAFASGMAALSALFLAHGRRGIVCVGDAYGGTLELLGSQLPGLGMTTHQLLLSEIDRLEPLLALGIGLVFFETPTNPRLELVDIAAVSALAHRYGALVAIDNTFASPVNQRPLALGVDIAMQSATKFLGGHSDLTAGVLCGSRAMLAAVRPWRKNLGQTIAPETAHRLSQHLGTLSVRVERQNSNAQGVAEFLAQHPRVKRVYYPGLLDFPGHALACSQMTGFGGMVSFDYDGDLAATTAAVERLRLIRLAPSLGGIESLVTMPVTTSHHDMSADERQRRGIGDSMVRLSVGIEALPDLIADLAQALA